MHHHDSTPNTWAALVRYWRQNSRLLVTVGCFLLLIFGCYSVYYGFFYFYILEPTEWQLDRHENAVFHPTCPACKVPVPPRTQIVWRNPMGNVEPIFMDSRLTVEEVAHFYLAESRQSDWTLTQSQDEENSSLRIRFENAEFYLNISPAQDETFRHKTDICISQRDCWPGFAGSTEPLEFADAIGY